MCAELPPPEGNWSSYPPHRHDGSVGCPVNNEEIYYFRVGRIGSTEDEPEGFAQPRTYPAAEPPRDAVEVNVTIRGRDAVLIPHGHPGPGIAAPRYPPS